MPFIRESKLEELERLARRGEDIKKLEKRYQKQVNKIRDEYEEKIEDLTDVYDREIHVLERKVEKAEDQIQEAIEDTIAKHEDELEEIKRESDKAVDTLVAENAELTGKIDVLETRVKTASQLAKREFALEERELELISKEKFVKSREGTLEAKIKEFDSRVKDENEVQYKTGYTNGVSDTLREGQALAENANTRVYDLADKAISKDTTVITTTAPKVQKQGK